MDRANRNRIAAAAAAACVLALGVRGAGTGAGAIDRGRIAIQGIVVEGGQHSFTLLSGEARISCQMQDWDWYENYSVLDMRRVIVFAPTDPALFRSRVVRPDGIYVADLRTYYRNAATAAGDGQSIASHFLPTEPVGDYITVSGVVESRSQGRFVLETGGTQLTVDVHKMASSDQLARSALDGIAPGDRVTVYGDIGDRFWDDRLIEAVDVVKLETPGGGEPPE